MRRWEEATSPSSCINKAQENEMVFVLLSRDKAAPEAIRAWVRTRIEIGLNNRTDYQITEALNTANTMEIEQPLFSTERKEF